MYADDIERIIPPQAFYTWANILFIQGYQQKLLLLQNKSLDSNKNPMICSFKNHISFLLDLH